MEVIVPGRTVIPSSDGKATVSAGFMDTRMPASRPNILRYSDCSRNNVIFSPKKQNKTENNKTLLSKCCL